MFSNIIELLGTSCIKFQTTEAKTFLSNIIYKMDKLICVLKDGNRECGRDHRSLAGIELGRAWIVARNKK